MKRYDIPQIKIIHFLTEIFVTSSGEVSRPYINEIESLETALGSAQHEKRMEDFTDILRMN